MNISFFINCLNSRSIIYRKSIFYKFNYNAKFLPMTMVRMRLGGATNQSFKNIIKGNIEIISAWKDNRLKIPWYFFLLKIFKRVIQYL